MDEVDLHEDFNGLLEEDLLETVNHRLLAHLAAKDVDVDQLHGNWSLPEHADIPIYDSDPEKCIENIPQEERVSSSSIKKTVTFKPTTLHLLEDVKVSQEKPKENQSNGLSRTEKSVSIQPTSSNLLADVKESQGKPTENPRCNQDFDKILTEFKSKTLTGRGEAVNSFGNDHSRGKLENFGAKHVVRACERNEVGPALPPRPLRSVPDRFPDGTAAVPASSKYLHDSSSQPFTQTLGKPYPGPQFSPLLRPKNVWLLSSPSGKDNGKIPSQPILDESPYYSSIPMDNDEPIYETVGPFVETDRDFLSDVRNVQSVENAKGSSTSDRGKAFFRPNSYHEENAKRVNEELKKIQQANQNTGFLSAVRPPVVHSVAQKTDKTENNINYDKQKHESMDVQFSTRGLSFEMPKEFSTSGSFASINMRGNDGRSSTRSQERPYDHVATWETNSTASNPCSWLADEPLYQHTGIYDLHPRDYGADACGEITIENDGFQSFKPSADFAQEQLTSINGRTLWCQVHSVIASNILDQLSSREKDLQEAKFEIYTTEFSFLKSLKVLKSHFITSSELSDEKILSRRDRSELFMYVKPVMSCSKAFLTDLEACWKESIFMQGIFEVICKHAKKNFDIYITYCSYLKDVVEKLESLCAGKNFAAALNGLERSEKCSRLPLLSFLTLPMERITCLGLLIKKALSTLIKEDKIRKTREYETEFGTCLLAYDYVEKICQKSNEACLTRRRIKKLIELSAKLRFPVEINPLALVSEKRWIVMHGEVMNHGWWSNETPKKSTSLIRSMSSVGSFTKSNKPLTIYLLNDYIVLVKKRKSDGSSLTVVDYCHRDHVSMILPSVSHRFNSKRLLESPRENKMLLGMAENHEKKNIEMVLSCALKNERNLWVQKLTKEVNKEVSHFVEKPYVCVYPFTSSEEDQLSLVEGDEVTVTKKLAYGWLEGIRSRDKKKGLFPPSRVKPVQPKTASRNYFDLYFV